MIENEKKYCQEAIDNATESLAILEKLEKLGLPYGVVARFNVWDGCVLLTFSDYKLLHKARKIAQAVLPGWDGNIGSIWAPYENCRCASWEDKNHKRIKLHLSCTHETFPSNLTGKEDCGWITTTETKTSFVCNL